MALLSVIFFLGMLVSYGQQKAPETVLKSPQDGHIQSVTGGIYAFGPMGLPNNGEWELDPVINRGGYVQVHYPNNSYKLGIERHNIFGTTPVLGIYNKKIKLNIDARNYSRGGFVLSVHKSFKFFKRN